jgi:cysteinyl-tRNA synthetase
MAKKYFGDTFDIHGGGKDLIFPHHENEIAQSEGASGEIFVNTWIHHGFVTIKDEKMSKSLGNFLTIREMLELYSAETLRLFIFSAGYRTPLDFSDQAMKDAENGIDKIYNCLAAIATITTASEDTATNITIGKKAKNKIEKLKVRLQAAMDNDFNTAQALGYVFDTVKTLNKINATGKTSPAQDKNLLETCAAVIKDFMAILGLITQDPEVYVEEKRQKLLESLTIQPSEIEALITQRNTARADKDWAKADEIRNLLLGHNIEMKDDGNGTTWHIRD